MSDALRYPGGEPCPDCGAIKDRRAARCGTCSAKLTPNMMIPSKGAQNTNLPSLNCGRVESIITFGRGEEIKTLHCLGRNSAGQIANGLERLPGDGWEVLCRSTPSTILSDLGVPEMTDSGREMRRQVISRTEGTT